MTNQTQLRRALLGAVAGLLLATGLSAQTTTPPAEEPSVKLEKFVVTGSNIPSTETTAEARTFPVATIDRRLIEQSGLQNTTELLQKMTLSNGGSVPFTNNATGFTRGGTSTSLRGLGPDTTLVLVNGRRMAFYPAGSGGTTAFVDLNTIPLNAVERIEVLKDGASAVYGADAVAGVVNIIFRKGYDGAEFSVAYGNTTNKDSSEFNANLMYGVTTEKSSVMVGLNYYNREPIFQRDRSYSAVPAFLSSNASPPNFEVSRAAVEQALGLAPGAPITINGVPNTTSTTFLTTTGATTTSVSLTPAPENRNATNIGLLPASAYSFYSSYRSRFNFNEFAGSFPEMSRRGAFATWEREIFGSNVKSYGDMFYQQLHQIDELAPYATNNFEQPGQTTMVIPARTPTPILTAVETTRGSRTAVPGAFNPFNPFNQDISGASRIRLAEWGNRVFHTRNAAFAVSGGLRFDNVMDKWNIDAGVRYSTITSEERNKLISTSRWLRAVNANDPIYNPASPSYIGTTQPYNPFGYYRNPIASNAAPVAFATHWSRDENRSRLLQANFLLNTASLMEVPAGDVGFAFGAEFRRESISQAPDSAVQSGDILATPPSAVTLAQRKISSYFAELEIPLFSEKKSMDYVHRLSLNVAARYEDFLTSGRNAFVPKFGLRWEPLADNSLVVRGSWGQGFREPSLFELYSSTTNALSPITDPLDGTTESEQSVTNRGNRLLEAEDSESRNVGVVWSPKGDIFGVPLNGFTASFDMWHITREGTATLNYLDTVNRAVGVDPNGVPAPGGLRAGESIVRNALNKLVQVNSVFINAGQTIVEGFDVSAGYTWNTTNWGRFEFGALATYLDSYRFSTVPGVAPVESVDDTIPGYSADDAYLRWKGNAFVDWSWKGLGVRVATNYTHGFDDTGGDLNGNPYRAPASWIYDTQITYKLFPAKSRAEASWWSDLKLTVGCNNVLDEDPPFVADGGNNSNGYPGFLYNNTGRWIYFGLEKKL